MGVSPSGGQGGRAPEALLYMVFLSARKPPLSIREWQKSVPMLPAETNMKVSLQLSVAVSCNFGSLRDV